MRPSEDENVSALLTASQSGDGRAVSNIWRELTPAEQEGVLLTLLGMQEQTTSAQLAGSPDDEPDAATQLSEDAEATPMVEETELIPKGFEELRELTASENDDTAAGARPVEPTGPTAYRTRWVRRWKWSALVAAWAVTTIFAFTADVSAYGPMEWVVSLIASVVGGGLLVGTLVNFAVAAIPTSDRSGLGG